MKVNDEPAYRLVTYHTLGQRDAHWQKVFDELERRVEALEENRKV